MRVIEVGTLSSAGCGVPPPVRVYKINTIGMPLVSPSALALLPGANIYAGDGGLFVWDAAATVAAAAAATAAATGGGGGATSLTTPLLLFTRCPPPAAPSTVTISLLFAPTAGKPMLILSQFPVAVLGIISGAVARAIGCAPTDIISALPQYVYVDEMAAVGGRRLQGRPRAGVRVVLIIPSPQLQNSTVLLRMAGGGDGTAPLAASQLIIALNATLTAALWEIAVEVFNSPPFTSSFSSDYPTIATLLASLSLDPTRPISYSIAPGSGPLVGPGGSGGGGGLSSLLASLLNLPFPYLIAIIAGGVAACLGCACCLWWWGKPSRKKRSRTDPGLDHLRASAAETDRREEKEARGATTELGPSWKGKETRSQATAPTRLTLAGGGKGRGKR